ncbi:GIY-YIG nuclease family protein [Kistimonas asteriae]|uniref:GIY-YIG nuclease family protein n=1 Tax=Kistimonas asteriae TaxID=517724 RepID=UPI001BA444E6|nr:GIY-YIG nuclease family protein [Kistimonas asteriae]
MIIFTITNKITNQVYVGNTRNDLYSQWQKMVTAAEQQLDYPLYKDIRVHGADNFSVEVYDYVDTREELAEVEQDAIELFNAKSLKGYKTTTVCISPKKKPRKSRSVSAIEKELMSLLGGDSDFSDDDDETPVPITPKKALEAEEEKPQGRIIKAASVKQEATEQPKEAKPSPLERTVATIEVTRPAVVKPQATEAPAQIAAKPEAPKPAEPVQPVRASRSSSLVDLGGFELDSAISAQLAAITAAADAVLAGDISATESLTDIAAKPATAEIISEEAVTVTEPVPTEAAVAHPSLSEVSKTICGKEKRIREAIERHRQSRASRTSAQMNEEKEKISQMLAELNARAYSLSDTIAHH